MPIANKPFRYAGQPKDAKRPRASPNKGHGYGAAWDKFRKWYADLVPPICVTCDQSFPKMILDHNPPLTGPDDPGLFDETRVFWMCPSCHGRKTQKENRI